MLETTINPSELHLKKELNILRKAHFLCDPATSWRSSFNSNSVTANTALHIPKVNPGDPVVFDNPGQLIDILPKNRRGEKKVYLYNWANQCSNSIDSCENPDEEKNKGLLSDSVINGCDTIFGKFSEVGLTSKISGRKHGRGAPSRGPFVKYSSNVKVDCQSMSGGISSSTDLSEGNESSNSSKLITGNKKSNQKGTSGHASPVFSGSQCGNISFSSKFMQYSKREMSSGTPASHKSQNICENKKKSCHGSQDGTRFYNDWYGFKQINQQGCGVPCYWPKRKKGLSSRSSCSSLFDTPSKKFGAMLSRGQLHGKIFSTTLNKDFLAKSSQSSPLLISSFDDYDSSTEAESELSAYLYELDLEGRSRLDGKRWSIHRNQEDLSIPQTSSIETLENGSLSRKYRPRVFSDIVGQSLIVQSLENAILTGKIAPAYLFQGPRGTGKSSTAQVFAAALNCTSSGQNRPCGLCSECISFASGNGSNVTIVDSKNKKDVGILKLLLKNACCASMFSQCKVVIIENCHIFSTKSWFEFMKYLEQPLPCFVFIFISLDSKNLPRSVVSRCQKFLFGKIKDADISTRLCYICTEEMVDFDLEAINLISAHSDGSLKDAETMLHQLTVLNRKISNSLVYEIIGLVSEEKLIDLLLIALSSNTKKTMRRCRELLSCGVDPVAIMCQLTGLIVDIITGACQLSSLQTCKNTTAVQSLSEVELGRLQNALKILSDAEKQLPNSSERSTWFTSAILQLASINYPDIALSSSTRSSKNAEILFEEPLEMETGAAVLQCSSVPLLIQESDRPSALQTSTGQSSLHDHSSNQKTISKKLASDTFQINKFSAKRDNDTRNRYTGEGMRIFRCINTEKLDVVWQKCINRCRSETLRTLLAAHGKLVSVTSVEGVLIAYIVFVNGTVKSRAERFLSSITNSIEMVLKRNVEVRIGIVHEKFQKALNFMPESTITGNIGSARICSSDNFQRNPSINLLTNSDNPESLLKQKHVRDNNSSEDEGFLEAADLKMMESAYLQSTEKGEQTHLLRHSSTEKAFPMLQNGQTQSERKSPFVQSISLKHWQQELNNEIEELESNSSHLPRNLQLHKDAEWYNIPISPSLLHSNSLGGKFDNDGIGYDSGPVQNGICCWRINKSEKRKIKKGSHGRSKDGCVQCFMPPSS